MVLLGKATLTPFLNNSAYTNAARLPNNMYEKIKVDGLKQKLVDWLLQKRHNGLN